MSELPARRRADAERSIAAILDAAVSVLGDRPAASMSDVAAAAGVTRQTVYAHYPSRDALLTAVAERARERALTAIDAAAGRRGEPPAEVLERLTATWWQEVLPHARVLGALATAYPTEEAARELHAPIVARLERLARRGQRAGEFDRTVSAQWLASAFLALVHAAADEVASGRMSERAAGKALGQTVPRAFGVAAPARRAGRRAGRSSAAS